MMTMRGWPANKENRVPPRVWPTIASITPILPPDYEGNNEVTDQSLIPVLERFNTPKAIAGNMHAKYKNIVAEIVL